MPSTRRTDSLFQRFGPPVIALLLVVGFGTWAIKSIPARPEGPRYVGAGDPTPRSGGTFTFSVGTDIRSLDPHIAYDTSSYAAVRLLFDGLLDYTPDGEMIPSLAAEMPTVTNEGKTFQFRLREGVFFHPNPLLFDGPRELVAEDVRWSIERLLHPDTASPGSTFYQRLVGYAPYREGDAEHIAGIRVTGRYTVEFTLDQPDQTFLNALAMVFAYPVPHENYEYWEAQDDARAVMRHPIGTGPYALDDWERGVQLHFTRFDDYWVPNRPSPDTMVLIENLDGETAVGRFSNGDIDILPAMSNVHYIFFKSAPAWRDYFIEAAEPTVLGLVMNCEMAPFDDVHVRRAVALAVDRGDLAEMLNDRVIPAGQLIPPMIPGHQADMPEAQTYNLDRARAEMAQSGYPDGVEEPITMLIGRPGPGALLEPMRIQSYLRPIGINVEFRQVQYSTFLENTSTQGRTQFFRSGWHADFPDPSNFLEILFHSDAIRPVNAENRSFYSNPELDRILDEARGEIDPERRLAMYREANAIVARDAPWAVLYYTRNAEAWQPYVMGYQPHAVWANEYRNVWLDLPRRRVGNDYWAERVRDRDGAAAEEARR